MIIVSLPGTLVDYIINAPCDIESVIFEKFYPYVQNKFDSFSSRYYITVKENSIYVGPDYEQPIFYTRFENLREAYHKVMSLIKSTLLFSDHYAIMHAATVVINKKTVLLVGDSGAGKSVLSAYINHQEDSLCLSDDISIIFSTNKTIFPLSQYIYLREPSLSLLNIKKNIKYDCFLNRHKMMLETYNHDEGFCMDHLLFLNYDKEYSKASMTTEKNESYFEKIIKSMLTFSQIKNSIKVAGEIVNSIKIGTINYNCLKGAYSAIKDSV